MKELLDGMNDEEREIVIYGLRQLPMYIVTYISILFIMLLMHMVWQGILYSIVYFSIRRYSGGFHAATRIKCYIVSIMLVILAMFCVKYINLSCLLSKLACIIFCIGVFLISPVDGVNKILDNIEKKVYKKRACIIAMFWTSFAIIVPYEITASIVSVALFQILLMCILGLKFKN